MQLYTLTALVSEKSFDAICYSKILVSYGVKHEAVHPLSCGEDHHGGTAVQSVTSCHDVSARLQSIILTWLPICCLWKCGKVTQIGKKFWESTTCSMNVTLIVKRT